ncbi:hypothetical protein ACFY3N_16085 [Streptomyces sp. NPDC000348]|uniref:glycoside hydrolase family 78 protein n=1 Tax=Streptomyces sp. NPDC000348 TaxID=3364538 RepID=UPI0036C39EB1
MPTPHAHRGPRWPAALAAATAFVTVLACAVTADAATGTASPTRLRTQHLTEALGIDDTTPDLSWQITAGTPGTRQTAYRVQAATSPRLLNASRPDLWDSGRTDSAVPATTYAGSTAQVHVPAADGRAEAPEGARLLRTSAEEAVYQVGSGHWTFHSAPPRS